MNEEPKFNAPIAGMSLTAELGSRPWQQPPQYAEVEDVAEHYINKMQTDRFAEKLIDVLEYGVPLATIADTIMLDGVMEGVHTIDVGILVSPVIVENLRLIADSAEVEYRVGTEEVEQSPDDLDMQTVMMSIQRERGNVDEAPVESGNEDNEAAVDRPKGIMARRMGE